MSNKEEKKSVVLKFHRSQIVLLVQVLSKVEISGDQRVKENCNFISKHIGQLLKTDSSNCFYITGESAIDGNFSGEISQEEFVKKEDVK